MMKKVTAPQAANLAELEALVQRDLQLLNYPPRNWVVPRAEHEAQTVTDVLIIGGGMCGMSAAFALLRRGVSNLRILDRSDMGFEGPWLSFARMRTLRSPKHLLGPAQGLPNLTCRAWFEAQWGARAWQELDRVPRPMWMDYLRWFRAVLALPVENRVNVRRIIAPHPASDAPFTLEIEHPDGAGLAFARKVVLAGGRDSMAAPRIPGAFKPCFGTGADGRVQHSSEDIEFAALRGREVAVIGIGASAMDNAAFALEAGAARLHMLVRAAAVPRINKAKGIVYAGFTEGFPHLPDAQKLRRLDYIASCRVAPPRQSVLRVAGHDAFQLHMDSAVTHVDCQAGRLLLRTARSEVSVDHVILATGFGVELAAAPELAGFHQHIARWRDCVQPLPGNEHSEFLDFPYLGDGFEFLERHEGNAPYLRDLHCFNYAAAPSHGNVSGDIPSVSDGAERLANAILRHLFVQDAQHSWQALQAYDDAELLGDELDGVSWWPPLPEAAADDDP